MIIKSLYDIDILINNISLLDGGNAIGVNCSIIEDISSSIPTCNLEFNSSPEFMSKYPIVDGTPIVVKINIAGAKEEKIYKFRTTRIITTPNGQLFNYFIAGVIDFYELFRSSVEYAQKSTSSDVFTNVAQKNNLSAVICQTKDKQLWVASEQNLGKWLANIASCGWASETSGMMWFLDREKTLYYIDIDRIISESSNLITFVPGQMTQQNVLGNTMPFGSMRLEANSGDENLFNNGYGGENRYFSVEDYKWHSFSPNKVRATSNIININQELSQGLEENFCELDTGNFHSHYFLAKDQNSRVLSTYSTYVHLNCELFKDIKLGQVCTIQGTNASAPVETNVTNIKFFTKSIKTFITAKDIGMQFTLCGQGYNSYSQESY